MWWLPATHWAKTPLSPRFEQTQQWHLTHHLCILCLVPQYIFPCFTGCCFLVPLTLTLHLVNLLGVGFCHLCPGHLYLPQGGFIKYHSFKYHTHLPLSSRSSLLLMTTAKCLLPVPMWIASDPLNLHPCLLAPGPAIFFSLVGLYSEFKGKRWEDWGDKQNITHVEGIHCLGQMPKGELYQELRLCMHSGTSL